MQGFFLERNKYVGHYSQAKQRDFMLQLTSYNALHLVSELRKSKFWFYLITEWIHLIYENDLWINSFLVKLHDLNL